MHLMLVTASLKQKSFNWALMTQCCQEIAECVEISHAPFMFLHIENHVMFSSNKANCGTCEVISSR